MYEYNSELASARRRVAHSLLSGGMAEKVFIDANELFVDPAPRGPRVEPRAGRVGLEHAPIVAQGVSECVAH